MGGKIEGEMQEDFEDCEDKKDRSDPVPDPALIGNIEKSEKIGKYKLKEKVEVTAKLFDSEYTVEKKELPSTLFFFIRTSKNGLRLNCS